MSARKIPYRCKSTMNSVSRWSRAVKAKKWTWRDTYSSGGISHLSTLLHELIPATLPRLYGYSFIFNNQSNTNLGTDGYDNYQAPEENGVQLFSRRMWIGGSLSYFPVPPKENDVIDCVEQIRSVRTVGNSVFVGISRDFFSLKNRVMAESRTLVYTNEPYVEPERAEHSVIQKAWDTQRSLTVTENQLKRFSFLSYNLHRIHYDRAYCEQERLRNVVVSGPFIALIMLHYVSSTYPDRLIAHFKYKNREPFFVDEEAVLAIREGENMCEVAVTRNGNLLCGGTIEFG